MKRNLVNFTRGSQLLGHFSFMFAAGLKGPLIIAAMVIAWTSWWTLSEGLSDHEVYLVWMRAYAEIYGFMEFDSDKKVALETAFGGTIQVPITLLDTFPPVIRAWDHMLGLMGDALWHSALLLVPSFVLFYWFAARFGSRSKERKHERGAMLVTLPELVDELRTHNRRERSLEMSDAMGWKWRLGLPRELARVFPYQPSHLATVVYRGNHFRDAVRAKGGILRIVATGMWGRDEQETLRKLKEWNQSIYRVRGRIEKIFGTWKRCYGLRRMRWRGLSKAAVQVHLTAIAYNLKRTMNILAAQA